MTAGPAIVIVCALPSEAAPIVARWRLRRMQADPFVVYRRDRRTLIVSGVGAHASAAAVGYAAALHTGVEHVSWCNAGIAGHGDLVLGAAIVAHTVVAAGGTTLWHPFVPASPTCRALPCLTYDNAVTDYPEGACCEMEAAGFLGALARVGTADVATVFKVVSDNRASGLDGIVRARIDELIASRLAELEAAIDAGSEAAAHRQAIHARVTALLSSARYTRTQQRQLHELALRLHGHAPATWSEAMPAAASGMEAAAVLASLRAALASCVFEPARTAPTDVPLPSR